MMGLRMEQLMRILRRDSLIQTFDEDMFGAIVDRVVVGDRIMVFRLKDGSEKEIAV